MTLGTAIVVVAVIWLMVVSPGFRLTVIVAALGLAILVAVLVRSDRTQTYKSAPAVAATPIDIIARNDITLGNLVLKPSWETKPFGQAQPSSAYWTLEGTVTNNSGTPLRDLRFEVIAKDGNRIIGEGATAPYASRQGIGVCGDASLLVPAMQRRSFRSCAIHFYNMPPAAQPRAWYRVISINDHQINPPDEMMFVLTQDQLRQ